MIAGILAAFIVPRWQGETGFEARQFRDETVAALRFAQKAAIATRRTVCAAFSANQATFRISSAYGAADCTTGDVLTGPSGNTLVVTAPSATAYVAVPTPIIFDAAGRPGIAGATTITVNGLASLPIVVEAETGYVH